MFLIACEGGREVLWLSAGENLCATSSTFAGRRHMIGKVVTGCVAILPYHTATQDRGSECRDFGFISRIVTALVVTEQDRDQTYWTICAFSDYEKISSLKRLVSPFNYISVHIRILAACCITKCDMAVIPLAKLSRLFPR